MPLLRRWPEHGRCAATSPTHTATSFYPTIQPATISAVVASTASSA